jgi:hypothetical protein
MPRGKTAKSLALIDACRDILQEIQPAPVRAVCYQLFVRQLIESMAKTCTNRVSAQLVYAREEGLVPWDWIVDETREAERPHTWADPERYINVVMRAYRRDRWALQSRRVEIWSEKGTVRGTLAPVLRDYGVTFRVMHGYASATTVYEVAQESQADARPLIVFYVGDWDPSGLHMSAVDLPSRLEAYGAEITLFRLAIDGDEAARVQLPSFSAETKRTDARYQWFSQRHGSTCWELDAMSPVDLRARVEEALQANIDWDAWQRCDVAEQAERRSLHQVLGNWRAAIAGQATK